METFCKVSDVVPSFTGDISDQIVSCQCKVSSIILPAINDPQGYGCGASGERIELWKWINLGLDSLFKQWNPTTQLSSDKAIELVGDLTSAIDSECRYIWSFKLGSNPAAYGGRSDKGVNLPLGSDRTIPELKAYVALLTLLECIRKPGGTTDEGIAKALGDKLEEKDLALPIYFHHFTLKGDVWVAKGTITKATYHWAI